LTHDIEKRLNEILQRLPAAQAVILLEYAEFLLVRHAPLSGEEGAAREVTKLTAPVTIPRPENETVIKAIKRLRVTYPMLDARKLLNQTSDLMTQHVVHGRGAVEVIDDLELLFRSNYQQLVEDET